MVPRMPCPLSPCRVFASPQAWPLHDTAHSRQHEARALAQTVADGAPHALMARAGLSTARLALALAPHAQRVLVLAGPGNNGGDGLIAACHLAKAGRQVRVLHLADPQRLPTDAADALQQARAQGIDIRHRLDDLGPLQDADLLIDALLGLGATRPAQGALGQAIDAANGSGRPVLAIDLPSGLIADTGNATSPSTLRARWTLSLLTLKPGLFIAAGRDHAGEVWFDDLQAGPAGDAQAWLGPHGQPLTLQRLQRQHAQHKGSFGDLFVVGGAPGMEGAATLAARAALTAGAGRVYVSPLGAQPTLATSAELMQRAQLWNVAPPLLRAATVVCGCGGGAAVAATLPPLLHHAGRLVLDADALNAIAQDPPLFGLLAARTARGQVTVLTPHPLEAARLLGLSTADVQADRLQAAQMLADRSGAVVVLKGSGTVIAAMGQTPWINASGNAALATPGTGDVLAGWIGGLWSQPAPGSAADQAWWAARQAVWLHGHAADRHVAQGRGGAVGPLRAGDLVDAMAAAMG